MTKRIIRTSNDLPSDHWIVRQLPAGTSLRPYAEDETISTLTSAVQDALDDAGLSRSEVARLLGTTKSYVSQVLNGSTNMTLKTFGALMWAAGRQVVGLRTAEIGTEEQPSLAIGNVVSVGSALGVHNTIYNVTYAGTINVEHVVPASMINDKAMYGALLQAGLP